MKQKIIIESLSMDLLRVALGLNRGSIVMADRFKKEALKREDELKSEDLDPYLAKLVQDSGKMLKTDDERVADDALMYSTLFQNFANKL